MFIAEVDKSQRLLKLKCSQTVTPDEARLCFERTQTLLAEGHQGFRLLVDLSDLDKMDVACSPHIERLMETCKVNGVEEVVRVIPDPHKDIGFNIMSVFHYGHDVHIVVCESLEQAMEILAL